MWPYRLRKKPSVKADLAIYSQVVDASGQCMSVSLMLGFNLDVSSCDILVDSYKFRHKCQLVFPISLTSLHLYQKGPNCFLFYSASNTRFALMQNVKKYLPIACLSFDESFCYIILYFSGFISHVTQFSIHFINYWVN